MSICISENNVSNFLLKFKYYNKTQCRNYSATGGADSGPQSAAESPTEEKDGQFTNGT